MYSTGVEGERKCSVRGLKVKESVQYSTGFEGERKCSKRVLKVKESVQYRC